MPAPPLPAPKMTSQESLTHGEAWQPHLTTASALIAVVVEGRVLLKVRTLTGEHELMGCGACRLGR